MKDRATDDLEMRYREEVLADCKAAVAGRYPFTASSPDDVLLADFTRLFGPGALFDTFFKDNLEKFVDTSHSPWAWRPGAVKPSAGMLARFEVAQELREMFFSSGQQLPKVSFSVTLTDLDAAASRFVLQIDNQTIDDRHYSPPRKRSATWPASNPGLAAATFEDQAGAWAPAGFDGVWAWFRLIDVGKPQREADQRVVLSFQNSSHRARVIMEPASVRNPFTSRDWQHFSCGS